MLIGRDGAEDDLCEALSGKHPKTDASNDTAVFNEGEGFVLPANTRAVRTECRFVGGGGWGDVVRD